MKLGGIKEVNGKWVYDVPISNIYICNKCGKTIIEHIWVGNEWRNHIESYSSNGTQCSCSNCELNHNLNCDGKLVLCSLGKETDAQIERRREIESMAKEIVDNWLNKLKT